MIYFQQRRDFGEKINATFTFITEETRGLGLSLLFIVGPLALVGGIISGYGQAALLGNPQTINTPDKLLTFYASLFSGPQLVGFVLQMLAYVLNSLVTFSYIKLYIKRTDQQPIQVRDVWEEAQQYIGSGVLLSIATVIMIGFASLLLVFPGIYMYVVLSLAPAALVFDRSDAGKAISRSFRLISSHWWATFGLLFVMTIILMIVSMVFSIPAGIIGGLFGAGVLKDITALTAVLTAVSTVGTSVLLGITSVAIAFQYFSLVEEKEGTGLIGQIDSIGQTAPRPGTHPTYRDEEGEY